MCSACCTGFSGRCGASKSSGPLIPGKILGLILLSFISILVLSNVITALSSFFLAKDLDLLVSAPVDWLRLYLAKLGETLLHSSWMVALMAVPILTAYGVVYNGGVLFAVYALLAIVPMLILPAVVGCAVTLVLVNIFPARRTRDLLSIIALGAAGGVILLFRVIRPEQLARPEGFRNLLDFVILLRGPTSPFLPSEWASQAIMGYLRNELDPLPARHACGRPPPHSSPWARCCIARSIRRGSPRRRRAPSGSFAAGCGAGPLDRCSGGCRSPNASLC